VRCRTRKGEEEEEEEFIPQTCMQNYNQKNHVMDGYQKGHTAIQAGGLKNANNNNINARKNTVQNKT